MKSKTIFNLTTHLNGTSTLTDSENGQPMHSRIGPELEAHLVYADRARIEERLTAEASELVLYDVGMGTGANVLAVLSRLLELKSARGTLRIYSFESKPEGLEAALDQIEHFPLLTPWKRQLADLLKDNHAAFSVGHVKIEWCLKIGNFYSSLGDTPPADFIFFDFYSPKVVPDLWTREKFAVLRSHLGEKSVALFTYSAATPVRLSLLLAGFFVGEGISTRLKNKTTIAHTVFSELEFPLRSTWLSKLETSTSIRNVPGKSRVRDHAQWN